MTTQMPERFVMRAMKNTGNLAARGKFIEASERMDRLSKWVDKHAPQFAPMVRQNFAAVLTKCAPKPSAAQVKEAHAHALMNTGDATSAATSFVEATMGYCFVDFKQARRNMLLSYSASVIAVRQSSHPDYAHPGITDRTTLAHMAGISASNLCASFQNNAESERLERIIINLNRTVSNTPELFLWGFYFAFKRIDAERIGGTSFDELILQSIADQAQVYGRMCYRFNAFMLYYAGSQIAKGIPGSWETEFMHKALRQAKNMKGRDLNEETANLINKLYQDLIAEIGEVEGLN